MGTSRLLETRPVDRSQGGGQGGNGTYLTEEVHEAVVEGLEAGNYVSTVMAALGIERTNFYSWYRKGEPTPVETEDGSTALDYPDTIYGNFRRDVDAAQAKAEIYAVKQLRNHFEDDWRAAAEFLSRRSPERWNPKTVVEMTGKDGGPIQVEEQKREMLYERLDVMSIERNDPDVIDAESQEPEAIEAGDTEPEQQTLFD